MRFSSLKRHNDWRLLHVLGLLFAVAMLGSMLYLQVVEFVLPCLLCVYLRIVTIAYGATSLLAVLRHPRARGQLVYRGLFILYTVVGVLISGYIMRLQGQPLDQSTLSCEQGIAGVLAEWPFGETLALLFTPYSDCTVINWPIFGLSLPFLSLLGFIGLFAFEMTKYWLMRSSYHKAPCGGEEKR